MPTRVARASMNLYLFRFFVSGVLTAKTTILAQVQTRLDARIFGGWVVLFFALFAGKKNKVVL